MSAAQLEWAQTPIVHGLTRPAKLALLAAAAFALGLWVYGVDRAWAHLLPSVVSGSAPSFLHALAFTLATALCLARSRVQVLGIALGWAALDGLIECAQHPSVHAALQTALPGAAARWGGTFDPLDLGAALLGALLAGLLVARGLAPPQDGR